MDNESKCCNAKILEVPAAYYTNMDLRTCAKVKKCSKCGFELGTHPKKIQPPKE